ncbi:MAG: TonB-dependent receptor [Spirosomataceae bacterium]
MRLLFFIIFLQLARSVDAQITQTIRGKIIDKETQSPLPDVSIVIQNTKQGTQTETDGTFRFGNLPLGRYSISASMIGYNTVNLPNIEIGSAKEIVLNIEMTETPQSLKEVIVKAEFSKEKPINDLVMVSGRQFTVQESNRYAGGYGDAARMAMSFAGVTSAGNDQNNEIVIRGNSPKGLLWRLEGVEIPNPNHFADGQGSTSGIISMINSASLANSDFLTGAFPAEYGNAMSGVFDLRFRKGNDQKHEQTIQVGVIGLEASAEGPINKKGASYRFNARYSTLDLLFKTGLVNIETGGFEPEYRDMNFSINLPTQKAGTFTVFGVGGKSFASDQDQNSIDREDNGMGVVGLSHKVSVNKKGYFYSVLAVSREFSIQKSQDLINQKFTDTYIGDYKQTNTRFSSYYNHKFSNRSSLRIGLIASQLGYYFDDNRYDNTRRILVNFLNEDDKTYFIQNYAQWKYNFGTKLSVTAGIHYNNFRLNNNQTVEPRAGIRWQFAPNQALSAGFGLHSRLEPTSMYLFKRRQGQNFVQPNRNLGMTRAKHYIVGYDRNLGQNIRLKVEAYYQWLYDVPVDSNRTSIFTMLNSSGGLTNTVLKNDGFGENQGLELTLEKYFSKNYYFMATGSLFKSRYRAKDGKWRNTVFDNGFAVNLLGGKDFAVGKSKVHWLVLNGRLMWRGGNKFIPINLAESLKRNTTVQDVSKAYEAQLPDYWRIDLGIGYRINKKRATWTLSGDFQNVTNRQNIIREFYNNSLRRIAYSYALPIIPILNFKVDF